MTVPRWPDELPMPLRDGFEYSIGDGRQGFRTDRGPPSVRRRFSAVTNTATCSLHVEGWQRQILETFYEIDLGQGTLPFIMPSPLRDGAAMLDEDLLLLTDEDDMVLLLTEDILVMFDEEGMPSYSPIPNSTLLYRANFRLLVLPT